MTDDITNKEEALEDQETSGDDIVFDDDHGAALVKKLRVRIKALEGEKQEYLDGWQRMKADVINRDRAAEESRARVSLIVKEKILEDLLPVLDAFSAAFTGSAWEKVDANWRIGVEYIHTTLEKALAENGIESFGKTGTQFNPLEYDPADEIATSTPAEVGTVAKVIRAGYKVQDRVVRPARVSVFKAME
jgi:molecular chaperone GrpE